MQMYITLNETFKKNYNTEFKNLITGGKLIYCLKKVLETILDKKMKQAEIFTQDGNIERA